jgi:hypothetical protein
LPLFLKKCEKQKINQLIIFSYKINSLQKKRKKRIEVVQGDRK